MTYYSTKYFNPRKHASIKNLGPISTEQYIRNKAKLDKFQQSFISWWRDLKLDHIVMPNFGCQSCPNELAG